MSGLEITAVVVGSVWLGIITGVLVLVIRQIALVTDRLDQAFGPQSTVTLENEGPKIGSRVDAAILRWIPEFRSGGANLLLLSASCGPCREFAADLASEDFLTDSPFIVLLPGRAELAEDLARMLPAAARVIRDPDATDIAHLLNMQMVPSAIAINDGVVTAKVVPLDSAKQYRGFVESSHSVAVPDGTASLIMKGVAHG